MNGRPKAPVPQSTTPVTFIAVYLTPQTGMPQVYASRSRELGMSYDALIENHAFIFNKFGPQQLNLCRPGMHW